MITTRIMQLNRGDTVVCLKCGEHIKLDSSTMKLNGECEYIECPYCKSQIDTHYYFWKGVKVVRK